MEAEQRAGGVARRKQLLSQDVPRQNKGYVRCFSSLGLFGGLTCLKSHENQDRGWNRPSLGSLSGWALGVAHLCMYTCQTLYTFRPYGAKQLLLCIFDLLNRKSVTLGCLQKAPNEFEQSAPNQASMIPRHCGCKILKVFLTSQTVQPWGGLKHTVKSGLTTSLVLYINSYILCHNGIIIFPLNACAHCLSGATQELGPA